MSRAIASLALSVSLCALLSCSPPEPPLRPATPEALESRLSRDDASVGLALEAIRSNPWGWGEDDFSRLRAFLVRSAQAGPGDDSSRALYILLEGRRRDGAAFASLSDLLRVYNGSDDPGVRVTILEALPKVAPDDGGTLAFLEVVATRSGAWEPLASEAAVRGLARIPPAGCEVLRRALDNRAVTDAAAAAVARALLDPDGPEAPGLPAGCRERGWGRLLRGG